MGKLICPSPWNSVIVHADGHVHPCCHNKKDRFHFGNLKEQNFDEIRNSPGFVALRQAFIDGDLTGSGCEGCPVLAVRDGDIPFTNIATIENRPPEFIDNYNRLRNEFENGVSVLETMPFILQYAGNYLCNIQCDFCCQHFDKGLILGESGTDLIRRLSIYLNDFVWIGGEPSVQREFKVWADEFTAEPNQVHFIMITNGVAFDQRLYRAVRNCRGSFIWISMDACEKELYEVLRKGGKWEKVLGNFRQLVEIYNEKPSAGVGLQMVLQKRNWLHLPDFIRFCDEYAVRLQVNPLDHFPVCMSIDIFDKVEEEVPPTLRGCMVEAIELARKLDEKVSRERNIEGMAERFVRRAAEMIEDGIRKAESYVETEVRLEKAPNSPVIVRAIGTWEPLAYTMTDANGVARARHPADRPIRIAAYTDIYGATEIQGVSVKPEQPVLTAPALVLTGSGCVSG